MGKFRKEVEIPIFGGTLVVEIVKNWKKLNKQYNCNYDSTVNGTAYYAIKENGGSEFVIAFLGKPSYALIVHECIHWVNAVFRYRGVKLDPKNDELQAYFTEWVFQKTVDILEENYV